MPRIETTALWWIGLACFAVGALGFFWWERPTVDRVARAMDASAIPAWGRPAFWGPGIVEVEVAFDDDSGEVLGRATCESACDCFKDASELDWGEVVSGLPRDFGPSGWWSQVLQSGGVVPNPASTRSAFKVSGGRGYVVVADCRRGSFVFWGRVS